MKIGRIYSFQLSLILPMVFCVTGCQFSDRNASTKSRQQSRMVAADVDPNAAKLDDQEESSAIPTPQVLPLPSISPQVEAQIQYSTEEVLPTEVTPEFEPSSVSTPSLTEVFAPDDSAEWMSEEMHNHDLEEKITLQGSVRLPFRPIFAGMSFAIRNIDRVSFQNQAFESESNPRASYNDGEIPVGKKLNAGTKRVLNVDVPAYQSRRGIYSVEMGALNFPVIMSRAQNQGNFVEKRLDSNSVEAIRSSARFGDDVSLRISPFTEGNGLRLEACILIPGVSVTIPEQVVALRGKIEKFIKISVSTKVKVNVGYASFDYVRGCYATEISFPRGDLLPKIALKTTELPKVANARFSGISIKFTDWWTKFLDAVVDLFTTSIRKKVAKIAMNKAENYRDEELTSGKWFTKVHGEEMLDKAADAINQSISKSFLSMGIPSSASGLREYLDRKCELIPVVRHVSADFKALCHQALASVHLSIRPFTRDAEQEKLGCYEGFGNVHASKGKWWAKGCGITFKIQVSVKKSLRQDVRDTLNALIADLSRYDEWIDEAAQRLGLSEDESALIPLVLDRALGDGRSLDSWSDLSEIFEKYRSQIESSIKL